MKIRTIAVLGLCLFCTNGFAQPTLNNQGINNMPQSIQSTADKNQLEGDSFLKTNKTKPGVVTLADGLQYKIITAGSGGKPSVSDTVTVHYVGTFIDGKEFDSSYKRNAPTSFPINAVIPGWTEALQLMPIGSTWELYIPANLAYGANGMPGAIEPNKTLIFKVTLLSIKK